MLAASDGDDDYDMVESSAFKARETAFTATAARPDTPTRHCSARPRGSKGSFSRESCWSATGCSMAKGLRRGIKQSTHTRSGKKLGRIFRDLSGPKVVKSHRGKRYTLIVRDNFSRYTSVYFMRHNSDGSVHAVPLGYSCR